MDPSCSTKVPRSVRIWNVSLVTEIISNELANWERLYEDKLCKHKRPRLPSLQAKFTSFSNLFVFFRLASSATETGRRLQLMTIFFLKRQLTFLLIFMGHFDGMIQRRISRRISLSIQAHSYSHIIRIGYVMGTFMWEVHGT